MIGQKTINSFFSPVSKKRICKDLSETKEDAKDPVSLPTQVKLLIYSALVTQLVDIRKSIKLIMT